MPETSQLVAKGQTSVFLAQFMGSRGCETLFDAAKTMASIGYENVQLPPDTFDLKAAAESKGWCEDNLLGLLTGCGLRGVSEISYHLFGQCIAVHPAYQRQFAVFTGNTNASLKEMYEWGVAGIKQVIDASANLGLHEAVGFTGSLGFPYIYPWPQRPAGLIEEILAEQAARWLPILQYGENKGVRLNMEPHPGEDVFDGYTFELYYEALKAAGASAETLAYLGINYDPSHLVLQQVDPYDFLEAYMDHIGAFHFKDAEFNPDGSRGAYGSYAPWGKRAGNFRTPGRGEVDWRYVAEILKKKMPDMVWTLEWEDPDQDARQGAEWAYALMTTGKLPGEAVKRPDHAFDDFAGGGADTSLARELLGLNEFAVRALAS